MSVVASLHEQLIEKTASILTTMVMVELDPMEPQDVVWADQTLRLGAISFDGPAPGHLTIAVSDDGAAHLAARMLCLDDPGELGPEEVDDALREIANMVMGAVKADERMGLSEAQLSIPVALKGQSLACDESPTCHRVEIHTQVDQTHPMTVVLSWTRA